MWEPRITVEKGIHLVESETRPGPFSYEVNLAQRTCTCKAFYFRIHRCKHIKAAERFEQEKYFTIPREADNGREKITS